MVGAELRNWKIPAFSVSANVRDQALINKIAKALRLEDMVYDHSGSRSDGIKRSDKSTLAVRRLSSLKDCVVPFFYNKLSGYKAIQFQEWLENIGRDPDVRESYKLIYRLYKSGYWNRKENYIYPEFWD